MNVAYTIEEIRNYIKDMKTAGKTVGLVPTMGFLHRGHASLIQRSVEENDCTVVSDFVNPIQFGPNEDLESYPRDFDADCRLCESLGADIIFHPEPGEMYENPRTTVDITGLSDGLCGSKRPGHFRGVCTVVSKLFNIVKPDRAYFGEKDAQQLAIIKKMVRDLNFDVQIVGCPIVREADGLAMSSRNTYLSEEERRAALCLSKAVETGRAAIERGMPVSALLQAMRAAIDAEPLAKIDYLSVVDSDELKPLDVIDRPVLIAMAVYIGNTRLIDNFFFDV